VLRAVFGFPKSVQDHQSIQLSKPVFAPSPRGAVHLRTQRAQLEHDVAHLDGTVVAWYGGQEHATPGWEHQELDRFLADAARRCFDAVIVAYADRWSKDNAKSKEGLEVIRTNGIRFFVGTTEMDLYRPEIRLMLGMTAEVGEFLSLQQTRKALENRIARANRGYATCGKLPWGRRFNRSTETWEVDPVKQRLLTDIAHRYL
jgi:DNA invertase Pin-like site-specific DNA recombinase